MALTSMTLARTSARQRIYPLLLQFQRGKKKAPPPQEECPYAIERPVPEEYGEIVEVMYKSYFKNEPILKSLGVGKVPNTVLEDEIIKQLSQGHSLIARCKFDGCIVGGSVNVSAGRMEPDITDQFACTLSDQKMRQLFKFYAYIQRAPNLWNLACTHRIFEMAHVFVLPSDRGRGLSKQLMQASIDAGADSGFSLIRVNASANATARVCEQLGMKLVYKIPYCTYIGPNQRPVVDPVPPETCVRTYVVTPHMPKVKR